MISKTAFLAVIIFSFLFAGHAITIDGLFDDWEEVPLAYQDPQGDNSLGIIDFADFKITYDNEFLFIYFSIHSGELLLQDNNSVNLYIDADNDSLTGDYYGSELLWIFGDRSGYHYYLDGITAIYQNDLTLRMAPTITSSEFEIAISRSSSTFESENSVDLVQGKLLMTDGFPNVDTTPLIPFSIGEDYIQPPLPITFEKNDPSDIRLVTHNVWTSNLMDPNYQEHFRRIYQALNPDIVALQEMYENTNQLHSLFNTWFPNEQWFVSSQFRDNIIISKYPVLEQGYFISSDRTMVALLNTEDELGKNLIIFNSHLSCCGNNESRQYDADEFVSNWREWRENGNGPFTLADNTPFIHVGDFNLVGHRQQLTTLTEGDIENETSFGNDYSLDWDGSSITDLFSRHSHKRMSYTWRVDNSSFSPGKLDYVLYTDSVLDTSKHFVLQTMTMDSASLSDYELEEMDSYNSSDHSPRVMDIKIPDNVGIGSSIIPSTIKISAPYPNPFNPTTKIEYYIPSSGVVKLVVYNIKGQLVETIVNENQIQGTYTAMFNGVGLSSGIYLYGLIFDGHPSGFKKAILVK